MKRALLISAACLFIFGKSFSQVKVHVGANTTVQSTFILDQGLKTSPDYVAVTSLTMAPVGMSFGLDFNNSFGIQLEGIYSQYKQIYTIYNQVSANKEKIGELIFDLDYINIPMLLHFMSGSDSRARASFTIGPQLSILNEGTETLELYQNAANGIITLPDVPEGTDPAAVGDNGLPPGSTQGTDGTYVIGSDVPANFSTNLLVKNAQEQINGWKEQELHIVAGFGLDYDLTKDIYISAIGKIDYGITDMRNGDLITELQNATINSIQELFSKRSNMAVGVQLTVHYMFGGTRYFLKALR